MKPKCILCGEELPNKRGGRCYCKACSAYMRNERIREQNESIRKIKIAPDPPPKVKREVTLKRADMDYCRKCIHHGNFDHCVLCEYMYQTGHRRGCKPGVGCEKRETVAKRSGGTGERECERCGKHFDGGPKSHLCPECRYEMRRARALQMVEVRRK